jgi:thiol-disulfide isomerase/thioredoxin
MKIIKIDSIACVSCIIMNNIFDIVKNKYNFDLIEYDFDEDNEKIKDYNIKTLPTYIFIKDNIEIKKLIGENKIEEFDKILKGCEK